MEKVNIENEDEKWAREFGIRFSLATMNDIEELKEFMLRDFHPDEPVSMCTGIANGNSWVDRYVRYLDNKHLIVDPIKKNIATIPCSIIARSIVDNSIVGCNIGAIYSKSDCEDVSVSSFFGDLPMDLQVPHKLVCLENINLMMNVDLHYNPHDAFSELKDSGDLIHFLEVMCVSRTTRGKGLMAELCARGCEIAKDAGCKYTEGLATNVYSQRELHKLGNVKVLHEKQYADYKYDKRGRPFITDTGEHKVIQVIAIDLVNVDQQN